MTFPLNEAEKLINQSKIIANKYKALTGKPLGITGEVAEITAAKLLRLDLANARQAGYDATCKRNGQEIRAQIKGRCVHDPVKRGQRIGGIKLNQAWDVVFLVLLNDQFEPLQIYEADRPAIEKALLAPGSKARNERGALSIEKFKSIGHPVWSCDKD